MSCIISAAAAGGSWPFNHDESLLLCIFFHLYVQSALRSQREQTNPSFVPVIRAVFVYFVYLYLRPEQ